MALQTLVSRELSPRQPGVVTVGAFHSGTKHNIISELAHLQLTVRNTNLETRETLLKGIKRIAENLGRAAGLPEDKLPRVVYSEESTPPTVNNAAMVRRLKQVCKVAWVSTESPLSKPKVWVQKTFRFLPLTLKLPASTFQWAGQMLIILPQPEMVMGLQYPHTTAQYLKLNPSQRLLQVSKPPFWHF